MKKLIELDEAIKVTWKDTGYTDPVNVMTAIRDRLEALPTVDAVPVVRCKDCKSFSHGYCRFHDAKFVRPDGYCYWGERKDGDSNG